MYCSLDAPEEHIDYPLLYGSGKDGWADDRIDGPKKDCFTLLDKIIDYIPPPTNSSEGNFKMSISLTDTDPYFGKSLIGRIHQGVLNVGDNLHVINP